MINIKCEKFGLLQNNCYLITDDESNESALIDCTNDSDRMLDFVGNANLKYILLTHGHFDHIAGVAGIIKNYTNCNVIMNSKDIEMITDTRIGLQRVNYFEPNILADDGSEIFLGNTKIEVLSTPGHTEGGLCFKCDNNLFTGDTLFKCSCGRTDFPGGSYKKMIESLNKLASLSGEYNVYPGHEDFSTLDYERKFNPYIKL